ncbi:MAG: hypothetical protein OQJ93_01115 [Ignavibacteriaceae bacterium]|jgi:hypothetical protein|nr:hypothetical protein [Ignavibacteriaceae bacterium]MCW8812680.1 hypothetical protein [Chlorobium sp.]MCW8994543.1 hypothetical protein [Psychromonas sp.]MCW8816464.1 hypothetical protein [Ignavibacteriaceae bacterium]MCW8824435.1 hypothetical protein [Ignavibacteriaceae bacterium]
MKNLFITLVTFSLALIIGCQENQLTEPNTSLEKKTGSINRNIIQICCEVQDPFSGTCNLNGRVVYVHQKINRAMNPTGLLEIALHLEMDSKLCDKLGLVHLDWNIKGKSDDIVYVSEEGILLMEKNYQISNRKDIVLHVQYLVTTDGVGISNIKLVKIEK